MNEIICANHLEYMEQMDENIIDMTITSPPYDTIRPYKGYVSAFKFEPLAHLLYKVTKPGGVVVWVVGDRSLKGNETGEPLRQALYFKEIGFNLYDTMIYHKKNGIPFQHKNQYYQRFEYMFVFSKGLPKTVNLIKDVPNNPNWPRWGINTIRKDDDMVERKKKFVGKDKVKVRSNVWTYTTGYMCSTADKIAFKHPAVYPEKLVADHIITWTNPEDLIFDPMVGSGTTTKMAKKLKRKYLGIDIVPEYIQIAQERTNFI